MPMQRSVDVTERAITSTGHMAPRGAPPDPAASMAESTSAASPLPADVCTAADHLLVNGVRADRPQRTARESFDAL